MKKFTLFLLLPLICSSVAFGQKDDDENENDIKTSKGVKITKSDPYEVIDAGASYFKLDDGLLAIKFAGNVCDYNFQKFTGKKLNESLRIKDTALEGKINKIYFSSMGFEKLGEKLFYFYTLYDKPTTTEKLYAREVNIQKGGFKGNAIELISIPKKIASYFGYSKFAMDFSEDKSKFIIRYKYINEKKNDRENKLKFGMAVFDSNLDKKWENDVDMPYVESLCSVSDFTVNSKGTGYFLLKKYEKEYSARTANDPDNVSFEIFEVSDEGKGEIRTFKFQGNIITNIIMKENGAGEIICAGYYSKPKSRATDGAFSIILNKNGEFSKANFNEFSADLIKMYNKLSERKEKKIKEADEKGDLGMSNLSMRTIQNLSDGSILLTGEIYYVTTTTDSKGNTRSTYHYDDVILTKINVNGTVDWFKKVPKRSTSGSFRQFSSDDYVYVTFRDNIKNESLSQEATPYRGNGAVIMYQIDLKDGKHEYKTLFSANKIDDTPIYQFNLYRIIPLTDTKFAVETYVKNKQDMMFQIEFNEK